MPTIVKDILDPVLVKSENGRVELRIGQPNPGETRYASLTRKEARRLAYALLSAAEDATETPS
jgi:hypothetical protein